MPKIFQFLISLFIVSGIISLILFAIPNMDVPADGQTLSESSSFDMGVFLTTISFLLPVILVFWLIRKRSESNSNPAVPSSPTMSLYLRFIIFLAISLAISGVFWLLPLGQKTDTIDEELSIWVKYMKLTSFFLDNETIPAKYTCDGENISPALAWNGIPRGTKSFALRVIDPDAPSGHFIHWLVANIPADVTLLKEGAVPAGEEIENDFGRTGWGGPCPPSGEHRYIFTLDALDTEKLSGLTKDNFEEKVDDHSIIKIQLTGRYQRQ